jgi:phosphoenolpyruvate-protein kinase (PTS system EI component)
MSEKIFNGIGASPGIVIGRVYLLDRRKVVVAGQRIEDVNVKSEVARFKKAVEVSKGQRDPEAAPGPRQISPVYPGHAHHAA